MFKTILNSKALLYFHILITKILWALWNIRAQSSWIFQCYQPVLLHKEVPFIPQLPTTDQDLKRQQDGERLIVLI